MPAPGLCAADQKHDLCEVELRVMKISLRQAVLTVAVLNLGYFGIEFAVATAIGSVSLFADSVDFLEDASVNLLITLTIKTEAGKSGQVRFKK